MAADPEQVTTSGDGAPPTDSGVAGDERTLRELAIAQAERVRRVKLHAMAYVSGIVVLGVVWMLTQYYRHHTWPHRFSDTEPTPPGTWGTWYFYVVGIWGIVLAVHAFKTFAHRPPTEAEIQRELDRLTGRR